MQLYMTFLTFRYLGSDVDHADQTCHHGQEAHTSARDAAQCGAERVITTMVSNMRRAPVTDLVAETRRWDDSEGGWVEIGPNDK